MSVCSRREGLEIDITGCQSDCSGSLSSEEETGMFSLATSVFKDEFTKDREKEMLGGLKESHVRLVSCKPKRALGETDRVHHAMLRVPTVWKLRAMSRGVPGVHLYHLGPWERDFGSRIYVFFF